MKKARVNCYRGSPSAAGSTYDLQPHGTRKRDSRIDWSRVAEAWPVVSSVFFQPAALSCGWNKKAGRGTSILVTCAEERCRDGRRWKKTEGWTRERERLTFQTRFARVPEMSDARPAALWRAVSTKQNLVFVHDNAMIVLPFGEFKGNPDAGIRVAPVGHSWNIWSTMHAGSFQIFKFRNVREHTRTTYALVTTIKPAVTG